MPDTATRPWFCPRDKTCPSSTHDDVSGYRRGCRSGAATEDRRVYNKRWREGRNAPRLVSPVGLARRIEACYAVGHTGGELAAALGVTRGRIAEMRTMKYPRMNVALVERIVPVLDRMAMRPPRWSKVRVKSLTWARMQGFQPLLAWDDIDDPAEAAPPPPDLADQIAELAARGLNQLQVARKLDLGEKTVRNRWPQVAVEVDRFAVDAVLDGRRHLLDCSDAEAEAVVERVFRDYLGEGWEQPGLKTAERLEVEYVVVRRIRDRLAKRRRPVKESP